MKKPKTLSDEIMEILTEATLSDPEDKGLTCERIMFLLDEEHCYDPPPKNRPTKVPYLRLVK